MTEPLPSPASPSPTQSPAPPVRGWRRWLQPVLNLLRQGLTPHQLALTAALGTSFGLVPVLGITTLMSTFVAVRLRLNVAATLLIAHLWSPVQLLLIIPLMRWGARLWGGQGPDLTLAQLQHLFTHDWVGALHLLWHAMLGALALWAVGCLVLGPLLYFALRPILRRTMRPAAEAPAAPVTP